VQVRNRNSEEYNVLKIQLEGIIEELERHFEQVNTPGSSQALAPRLPRGTPCSQGVPMHLLLLRG